MKNFLVLAIGILASAHASSSKSSVIQADPSLSWMPTHKTGVTQNPAALRSPKKSLFKTKPLPNQTRLGKETGAQTSNPFYIENHREDDSNKKEAQFFNGAQGILKYAPKSKERSFYVKNHQENNANKEDAQFFNGAQGILKYAKKPTGRSFYVKDRQENNANKEDAQFFDGAQGILKHAPKPKERSFYVKDHQENNANKEDAQFFDGAQGILKYAPKPKERSFYVKDRQENNANKEDAQFFNGAQGSSDHAQKPTKSSSFFDGWEDPSLSYQEPKLQASLFYPAKFSPDPLKKISKEDSSWDQKIQERPSGFKELKYRPQDNKSELFFSRIEDEDGTDRQDQSELFFSGITQKDGTEWERHTSKHTPQPRENPEIQTPLNHPSSQKESKGLWSTFKSFLPFGCQKKNKEDASDGENTCQTREKKSLFGASKTSAF